MRNLKALSATKRSFSACLFRSSSYVSGNLIITSRSASGLSCSRHHTSASTSEHARDHGSCSQLRSCGQASDRGRRKVGGGEVDWRCFEDWALQPTLLCGGPGGRGNRRIRANPHGQLRRGELSTGALVQFADTVCLAASARNRRGGC
jgi:hypothetical protein